MVSGFIKDSFEHLLKVLSSDRFLNKQGLGNEVPFFIFPFPPEFSNKVSKMGKQLMGKLKNMGIDVLKINLYDLSVELLEKRGIWQKLIEIEKDTTKEKFKEILQGPLDIENHLIPAIAEKMKRQDFDLMFITGVGEVFPYIRSHTVLNNLQSTADEKPTVMFFPGEFIHSPEKGASLELFGRLHDDNYYRAFNIAEYKV
ncbi:MAG: DUF1788 domain-containing protein [Candidatus Krumholzibacteriota bacterium]|nr:DUF1788 domain-containing protein [Candidatus Krumholzibacteriota bacterium]